MCLNLWLIYTKCERKRNGIPFIAFGIVHLFHATNSLTYPPPAHTPRRDLVPDIPTPAEGTWVQAYPIPVDRMTDRMTPAKTLPSRNFVSGR